MLVQTDIIGVGWLASHITPGVISQPAPNDHFELNTLHNFKFLMYEKNAVSIYHLINKFLKIFFRSLFYYNYKTKPENENEKSLRKNIYLPNQFFDKFWYVRYHSIEKK